MNRTHQSRAPAMISLLGCLLLSTPMLAQTGGAGGSVNGGAAPSPGSEAGLAIGMPALPTPPASQPGTYGTLQSAPGDNTTGVNPNCSMSGPNCYSLSGFPQVMPTPPPSDSPPQ